MSENKNIDSQKNHDAKKHENEEIYQETHEPLNTNLPQKSENSSNESISLNVQMDHPELFFGLVAPIGTAIDIVQNELEFTLKQFDYNVHLINVSELISDIINEFEIHNQTSILEKPSTIRDKINAGNAIRKETSRSDFLAMAVVNKICKIREEIRGGKGDAVVGSYPTQLIPIEKTAFIIRQLKRSEEIDLLRSTYGDHFIQISANSDYGSRLQNLKLLLGRENRALGRKENENNARMLIHDDAEQSDLNYGQRISETFYTGDFFINTKKPAHVESEIRRFIKGIFGSNLISPTKDEYGSYFAKSASLKSVDLSRQVGAAIFTDDGDIVTLGCNDVAKAGGGLFWEEDSVKFRDIDVGGEANKEETSRIIHNFLETLRSEGIVNVTPEQVLGNAKHKAAIEGSMIGEITEYGRMIHAEMSAITDAARLGRNLKNTNLYVTTYPCHNCAKHVISSGIRRVIYIEPYPKSRAELLYDHAISEVAGDNRVEFDHFYGISPRLYRDIFEKSSKRRGPDGKVKKWVNEFPSPIFRRKDYALFQAKNLTDYAQITSKLTRKN